jgi:hypothetical protein
VLVNQVSGITSRLTVASFHHTQGNCLLVGVGGSGNHSLSRLAAYTAGCEVFEITLTRGYDETSFREDLKELYGRWPH